MTKEKAEKIALSIQRLINARFENWSAGNETVEEYWQRRDKMMEEARGKIVDALIE